MAPVIVRHVDFRLLLPTTVKNFDRITRLVADQEVTHEAGILREASGARLAVGAYKYGSQIALALAARIQNVISVAVAGAILAFLALLLPLGFFPRTRRPRRRGPSC